MWRRSVCSQEEMGRRRSNDGAAHGRREREGLLLGNTVICYQVLC